MPEEAWHRRQRQERKIARNLLSTAATLIKGHHGSSVPGLVTEYLGGMVDDECFIWGPKEPHWICGCGRQSNWACRVECTCGKQASLKVRNRARDNAYQTKERMVKGGKSQGKGKQPGVGMARPPQGAWTDQAKENRALKQQVRDLKANAAQKKQEPEEQEAEAQEEEEPQRVQQQKTIRECEAILKLTLDPDTKAFIQAKLDGAKSEAQASRPVETQHIAAMRKLAKARKKAEACATATKVAKDAILAAQVHFQETSAEQGAADLRVEELSLEFDKTFAATTANAGTAATGPGHSDASSGSGGTPSAVSFALPPEVLAANPDVQAVYSKVVELLVKQHTAASRGAPTQQAAPPPPAVLPSTELVLVGDGRNDDVSIADGLDDELFQKFAGAAGDRDAFQAVARGAGVSFKRARRTMQG
jgi:hypothetical protein